LPTIPFRIRRTPVENSIALLQEMERPALRYRTAPAYGARSRGRQQQSAAGGGNPLPSKLRARSARFEVGSRILTEKSPACGCADGSQKGGPRIGEDRAKPYHRFCGCPCASGCCTGVPCSLCKVRDDGEALRIPIFSRSMTGCVEQSCANPWWLLLIALRIRQGLVFSARTLPSGKEQVEIRRWCAFSCKQVR
jgi:hypothetical protein